MVFPIVPSFHTAFPQSAHGGHWFSTQFNKAFNPVGLAFLPGWHLLPGCSFGQLGGIDNPAGLKDCVDDA